ncbi:MAG: histidine kinase dimerization/phospho-acceptor domain-containing protein, partial [Ectothiorhodospiraceae bacterium]
MTERDYRVSASKIGCIVALVLVPAGATLDYVVYPDQLRAFLLLRLLCDAFLGAILALHFTRIGQRQIPILTFAWLMACQGMISYMIYVTEGFQSTYYAGLNLAMLGVGILLPTSVPEAILFCAGTLALYTVSCTASPSGPIDFSRYYNNIYFLALTAVISITAVYVNARRRFSEFRLSYELDERNKELAELDRLKSEFFANVSHELRTPLTLILAPVEDMLERRSELPEAVAERLGLIRTNAVRLLRLVNDLLEVIRLEEGRVELERRPIDLRTLLGGILDAMVPLAENRGIALERSLPEQTVWVRGDRGALEKIFFNLLSNALKFTESGGRVRTTCRVGEDGQVAVTVEDSGIGISEAHL